MVQERGVSPETSPGHGDSPAWQCPPGGTDQGRERGWGCRHPSEQERCHWAVLVALRRDVHALHWALQSENVSELPKTWWGAHVRRALKSRLGWAGPALTVWRGRADPPVQGPWTTHGRGEIQHFLLWFCTVRSQQGSTESVGVVGHQQGQGCCSRVTRGIGTSRCPNPPYEVR